VLLREVDARIGLMLRLAACFVDYRNHESTEYPVQQLLFQSIYALVFGYECLNDHDVQRTAPLLALLVGQCDVTGERRIRDRDKRYRLACTNTLNRLELNDPVSAAGSRYKKIAPIPRRWIACWWTFFSTCTAGRHGRSGWIIDATDDPLHDHQEGRFFHGYYGCYCSAPWRAKRGRIVPVYGLLPFCKALCHG
jgi:hypothetical protein